MTEMKRRTLLGLGVAAAGGLVLGKTAEGAAGKKAGAAGSAAAPAAGAATAATAAGGGNRTVVVWSEGTAPKNVYPNDINGAIAEGLKKSLAGWDVVVANLSDADQGLPDGLLAKCDVLIWWGHKKHKDVKDELVARIVKRVKDEGMGFIALHSSHFAKPNKALMGTPCTWGTYKVDATTCTLKVKDPKHPICEGLPAEFTFKHEERYSEPYAVPEPKAVPLDGFHLLKDGSKDNARFGLCWDVGKAKYFYFMAGHETNPVFMDANVQKIMANAVKWAAPAK
jgi:trehalose utilization protein